MTIQGISVKSVSDIDLSIFDIYQYGGCSKVYLDRVNNEVYKEYRDRQSIASREFILKNILELRKHSKEIDGKEIILPDTLYFNDEDILAIQKMSYIKGGCGINTHRKIYMTKKYYLIIFRLINLVKKYTHKNFVFEDLKLSNIIFDNNMNPFIIDNDYTQVGEIAFDGNHSKSVFIREYLAKFGDTLKPEYNLYCLYFIIAMLLLSEEELHVAFSVKQFPSYENLVAINYFIQKNRGVPQSFKNEMRNLLNAQKEIDFSENIKYDICDYVRSRCNK